MARKRIHTFDFDKFNNIDSIEKAYWLGFLTGDGSVSDHSLILEISNKDIEHLSKFKEFMNFTGDIKSTAKNCSVLYLNGNDFVKKLNNVGLIRNKTPTVLTPIIDASLLSHFYRGILDADGWITKHIHKKRSDSYDVGFSSANIEFLKEIKLWINQQCNNNYGYIIERKKGNQRCCQLIFGGNRCVPIILNALYKDANNLCYLTRKYEIYKRVIDYTDNLVDLRTTRFAKI